MSDQPARDIFKWFERPPGSGEDPGQAPKDAREPTQGELVDIAVLRSLMLLSAGQPVEFIEHEMPSADIQSWIEGASRRQLHGLLISALSRWHHLRLGDEEPGLPEGSG